MDAPLSRLDDAGLSTPTPVVIASPDPIAPDVLADLMIASALQSAADVVALRSRAEGCIVSVAASGRVLGKLEVPAEVGYAAAARLAIAAGLTPALPHGGGEGGGVARFEARVGDRTGGLVISLSAEGGGLDVEIHPLSVPRRPYARRVHLKRCPVCGVFRPPQMARCDDDGAALAEVEDDPRSGGTIGTYRITEIIGQGSMGVVYAAEHAFISKLVAIKVLHRALSEDAAIVRRFLREARATSRIAHRNVLEVTDYGMLQDGRPFMVMERIVGVQLDRRLERGLLPVRVAVLLAREIALGIEAAHAAGVLHNDLKPSNVLLLRSSTDEVPQLKVVDFGAASIAGEDDAADDITIGTPHYMAPERVVGKPAEPRSDVYALGILLYEMLSGQVPFTGGTNGAVMLAQVQKVPAPVTNPTEAVPARLVRLVDRALAKNPAERQQTMTELIAELTTVLAAVDRRTFWKLWG